jgi:hypothetical protein
MISSDPIKELFSADFSKEDGIFNFLILENFSALSKAACTFPMSRFSFSMLFLTIFSSICSSLIIGGSLNVKSGF